MTIISTTHIPRFNGSTIYVNSTSGSNDNSGLHPDSSKATITAAITAASAGDRIVTFAGTYAEDVDLNKNYLEFCPEIGTIIAGQSADQALKISGHYCKICCEFGALRVNAIATKTGVVASGNWAYLNHIRVPCGSLANIGFDITGDGCVLNDCRCSAPLTAAFKVQGDKIKLSDCCTGGASGDSSIGFWATNSCDKARLKECGSQGHETAGFQIDSGCTNGVIEACYSGGGDGKWTDADNAFVWSHFEYDRKKHSAITLTATGGVDSDGTKYNLFKITGVVRVFHIFGHVTTVLPATSSVPNLVLYSTNASIDITDDASGPDISAACVGASLKRLEPATEPLVFANPDSTPAVTESTNYRSPKTPVILSKDDAADTYIQMVLTAAMASGAMCWHIEWEPVTDDGFIEVV